VIAVFGFKKLLANIASVIDVFGSEIIPDAVKFLKLKSVDVPIVSCLPDRSDVKFVIAD
jgi:hypothetical protein